MTRLLNEEGHIDSILLKKFKSGDLDYEEVILMSEHISTCKKCSELLADSFNDDETVKVPKGFEEEVKNKIEKKYEKSNSFLFYSMKVSIAICMSLIVLFSNTFKLMAVGNIRTVEINAPNLNIVNSVNLELENFTDKIINMEVFNYENEKR